MNRVDLRPACVENAADLAAFFASVFDEEQAWIPLAKDEFPTLSTIADQLTAVSRESNSLWVLAWKGPELVGSLKLRGGNLLANAHIVTLDLHVALSIRGKGWGKRLLLAGIDWVRSHPTVNRIELECFAGNQVAISLYQSAGFIIEGVRQQRYLLRTRLHDTVHMTFQT